MALRRFDESERDRRGAALRRCGRRGVDDGHGALPRASRLMADLAPLRIGVTGHRQFDDIPTATAMIDAVLDRLLPAGRRGTIVSNLAEGADRLVAELVLRRRGTALEVILPLPRDDYARDFSSAESVDEFARLLDNAAAVETVEQRSADSRDAAYERAGMTMVDSVDVLIAVWDGAPSRARGGTADIIQYALDRDVVVEVVLVEREGA